MTLPFLFQHLVPSGAKTVEVGGADPRGGSVPSYPPQGAVVLLRQRSMQQQRHWVTFVGLLLLLGMTLACVTLYKNWVTSSQV